MTVDAWLDATIADAERRGLSTLRPLLESLANATRALRAADFNEQPREWASEPPCASGTN